MTQAPAAVFTIPAESPQLPRGKASRARKAAAPQPKAVSQTAGRASASETRAATRGDGKVTEPDLGITVCPPRR